MGNGLVGSVGSDVNVVDDLLRFGEGRFDDSDVTSGRQRVVDSDWCVGVRCDRVDVDACAAWVVDGDASVEASASGCHGCLLAGTLLALTRRMPWCW